MLRQSAMSFSESPQSARLNFLPFLQHKVPLRQHFWHQPSANVEGMKRKGSYYTPPMAQMARFISQYARLLVVYLNLMLSLLTTIS